VKSTKVNVFNLNFRLNILIFVDSTYVYI